MKLKATKIRMYKLAKQYIPDLPPCQRMDFRKTPRVRSWWLEGGGHKVYLGEGWGKGTLMDNQVIVARPSLVELVALGLVEKESIYEQAK